jgi:DNA-binding transcriptional LysR family regulator
MMASMAVFTKVVGAASFSAAPREMKVSQASVTKQIGELESWLGASGLAPRNHYYPSWRAI